MYLKTIVTVNRFNLWKFTDNKWNCCFGHMFHEEQKTCFSQILSITIQTVSYSRQLFIYDQRRQFKETLADVCIQNAHLNKYTRDVNSIFDKGWLIQGQLFKLRFNEFLADADYTNCNRKLLLQRYFVGPAVWKQAVACNSVQKLAYNVAVESRVGQKKRIMQLPQELLACWSLLFDSVHPLVAWVGEEKMFQVM